MLTPEQLQNLPQELTDLYGQLSEFILQDIARRLSLIHISEPTRH